MGLSNLYTEYTVILAIIIIIQSSSKCLYSLKDRVCLYWTAEGREPGLTDTHTDHRHRYTHRQSHTMSNLEMLLSHSA